MKYRQTNKPERQKLILADQALPDRCFIDDLAELKERLQEAIALEHFTIPPYLCALYSIKDGANVAARDIIRTVVVEEMLHMVMAANILNAIGGTPRISAKKFLPHYPRPLPHSAIDFQVSLLRFSKEAVNTFLRIERPAKSALPPPKDKFRSIGEFYQAVREALMRFDAEAKARGDKKGIFTGTQAQVSKENYYGSGGELVAVYSIEDANRAIDEIVGQGEGIDSGILAEDDGVLDEDVELAHYYRFNQIFCERRYKTGDTENSGPTGGPLEVDWNAVHNMMPNPKMRKFQGQPRLLEEAKAFNRTYMQLLHGIDRGCNGHPEELRTKATPLMHALREQAVDLMQIPAGDGNYTAGPTFEYVD